MRRRLVIGDIHGRIGALKQVLELSKFDYDNDHLILIGDVVDGGSDSREVVDELLKVKDLVFVLGNHDLWCMNYLKSGWMGQIWAAQGGDKTIMSYEGHDDQLKEHMVFFKKGVYFHKENGMLFVHGGFDIKVGVEKTDHEFLVWDRTLIETACEQVIPGYEKVFVGHTTTEVYNKTVPIRYNNLIMVDLGIGWTGKLCIMDIDTEEYWLNDGEKGTL